MFEVYHAKNPTFGFGPEPKWPDDFTLVAKVACDERDEAFMLTNNIGQSWDKNLKVTAFGGQHRSTSIWDAVKNLSTGKVYLCICMGWKEIKA